MNNSSKRVKVDKNKTTILILVAGAAVITVVALMISKGLWDQSKYLGKVSDKKEVALKQLEDNKVAIDSLTQAYEAFDNQNPNLLGGSPDGVGPRDGSNATLVLDALPNKYDFPALASSLESMLASYTIQSISGSDDSSNQQSAQAGVPVEMPFSFDVVSNYDEFKQLLKDFDRSIRPFQATRLELSGANNKLQITYDGKSYYQPESGLQITNEEVQ